MNIYIYNVFRGGDAFLEELEVSAGCYILTAVEHFGLDSFHMIFSYFCAHTIFSLHGSSQSMLRGPGGNLLLEILGKPTKLYSSM